jgi:hypothetical protein
LVERLKLGSFFCLRHGRDLSWFGLRRLSNATGQSTELGPRVTFWHRTIFRMRAENLAPARILSKLPEVSAAAVLVAVTGRLLSADPSYY